MPSRDESSMQESTPLSQAQNSVDTFSNAVTDAETHPTAELVQQAREAEKRATNAMEHLQDAEHQEPVERLAERFAEQRSRLEQTEASLNDTTLQ